MRIHHLPPWLCGLALVIGCQRTDAPDSADFGRFEGEVVAAWNDDGRHMTLREEFVYVDPQNRRWTAPAGSVVDGASIPQGFWTFIGGPFEGRYRNASVVHDVECVDMKASWEDVHRMFYEACRCGGVDERMAKILYYAVYHFGPRWQTVTETRLETSEDADGQAVQQEVTEQRIVRIDPPPPTLEEVEQVEALIAEENPEPDMIEKTDRVALRRRPRRAPGGERTDDGSERPSMPRKEGDRTAWKRPDVAAGGERTRPEDRYEGRPGQRGRRPEEPREGPAVTPEEQQWAEQQVRQHVEERTGQERPAEYDVERTRNGFRVFVRYHHLDEDGQPTGDFAGSSTIRLSRAGQVLEMTSGM